MVSKFSWNWFPVAVSAAMAGARLIAIPKKAPGEARPIAVGDIVRRVAGKCLLRKYGQPAAEQLRPQRLGVGAPGGVDVIVHKVRQWRGQAGLGEFLVKVDLKNAFNAADRDRILVATRSRCPALFPIRVRVSGATHGASGRWICGDIGRGHPTRGPV